MNRDFEPLRHLNRRPYIRWLPLYWRESYSRWRKPTYWVLYIDRDGLPAPLLTITDEERRELRPISPRNVQHTRQRRHVTAIGSQLPWPSDGNHAIMRPWLRNWSKKWSHIGHKFPDWR